MDPILTLVVGGLIGTGIGVALGWWLQKRSTSRLVGSIEGRAKKIVEEGRKAVEDLRAQAERDAEQELQKRLSRFERDMTRRKAEFETEEQKLAKREAALDKRFDTLERREQSLTDKEKNVERKTAEIEQTSEELQAKLQEALARCEQVSGMTAEEARKALLESLENEVRHDATAMIRRIEGEARETSAKKARQIITLAIQKYAAEQVSESTISVVPLSGDDIKGRIIGREGRNIRALEAATGCNFIVDDTPEAVVLSCFDPLRREVARLSLEKLLSDGRIHPGRIEDVVRKAEKEVADHVREYGEQAAFDLGIHGLHPELIRLVGRLRYRTSYGQNVLAHSMEVANLAKIMAAELEVDEQLAKRAGMLHDIGKAVSYEMEGTHASIGADLAKRYNESPAIVHAIGAHHQEEETRTIIAALVQAADAISAARPGARRETLETYVKRLRQLEAIADSFDGVTKSYAIQAGREIRILVNPDEVSDDNAALMARDITKKVEQELEYPGQIKVTVLREVRSVEYAK